MFMPPVPPVPFHQLQHSYEDIVCTECGRVAGQLISNTFYRSVICPAEKLWWTRDPDPTWNYVFADSSRQGVSIRLRRNRTCCGDNYAPCYWCGCWERDMRIVGDGVGRMATQWPGTDVHTMRCLGNLPFLGRLGHPICEWCYDWHNRYVMPQRVQSTALTLKVGRLLPRLPFSVQCNIAEYLVYMWEP